MNQFLDNNQMNCITLLSLITHLKNFWNNRKYNEMISYDKPMGAGTYHPATVFGCFRHNSFIHYLQPSRRPKDFQKGINSARFYLHHQYQVFGGWHNTDFIYPAENLQALVYLSLKDLGLNHHEITWKENNWNSTALGAYGNGWEVLYNGVEIAQVTYFYKMGGINLLENSIDYQKRPIEITYGLERILMVLTHTEILWNQYTQYKAIRSIEENTFLDLDHLQENLYQLMINRLNYAEELIEKELIYAAYDQYLDANNDFNNLDAAGLLSTEKRRYIISLLKNIVQKCCLKIKNYD